MPSRLYAFSLPLIFFRSLEWPVRKPVFLFNHCPGNPYTSIHWWTCRVPTPRTTFDSDFSLTPTLRRDSASIDLSYSHPQPTPRVHPFDQGGTNRVKSKAGFTSCIWAVLCLLYTLGTYRFFSAKFRFRERSQSSSAAIFDSTYAQWIKTLRRMCSLWRLARVGCGLLLPLSIALLQLSDVSQTVFVRTCTITTAIFAAAGLLSSGSYLFLRSELKNQGMRIKWVEASRHSATAESIEFWTFLALPLTSLFWAISSCALTIVSLAWTKQNGIFVESDNAYIGGGIFISALTAITLVHLYKAAKLLEWL
ncbi:hypothetical protein CVT26_003807 [Gymnopilus dilepis]|uniref:Uncharacterized protein n=1 Tax=Gymnopilus dilepis TaxID=231916 RepID=A0A409YM63_9AGAR|nr:hypothetical protein CVT26_003807 [Gymnopilus dilepis]